MGKTLVCKQGLMGVLWELVAAVARSATRVNFAILQAGSAKSVQKGIINRNPMMEAAWNAFVDGTRTKKAKLTVYPVKVRTTGSLKGQGEKNKACFPQ